MKYLKVVAAVISQEDKILIARRKKGKHLELKWEYPGGKLENNEKEDDALKRELKEELNIEIIEMSFFDEYLYEYKELSKKLKLVFYHIFQFEGEMQNLVHHQLKWIDISNLSDYDFLEGDHKIINKLIQNDPHI